MAGLMKVSSTLISAPGANNSPIRATNGSLQVSGTESDIPSEITSESSYDEVSGVLTLKFANGSSIAVKGFPTPTNIPVGRTGPIGATGADGKDGRDGRDGNPGTVGCTGPDGPDGQQGLAGKDGRQGLPGPDGRRGEPGPDGRRGNPGNTGPRGSTGPTGHTGATGPTGPDGPPGPAGLLRIIVSAVNPGNVESGTVWVDPTKDQGITWP